MLYPYIEQTTTLEIKAQALKKYPVVLEVYLLHNLVTGKVLVGYARGMCIDRVCSYGVLVGRIIGY